MAGQTNTDISNALKLGEKIPDKTIQDLVTTFVSSVKNCSFLLEGFPQNCDQARFLADLLINLKMSVFILDLNPPPSSDILNDLIIKGDSQEIIKRRKKALAETDLLLARVGLGQNVRYPTFYFYNIEDLDKLFDSINSLIIDEKFPI